MTFCSDPGYHDHENYCPQVTLERLAAAVEALSVDRDEDRERELARQNREAYRVATIATVEAMIHSHLDGYYSMRYDMSDGIDTLDAIDLATAIANLVFSTVVPE